MQQLRFSPFLRLMRLHQPVGIWLLLWPCWWAVALATPHGEWPSPALLLAFAAGAAVMRASGCIINDLWDRDLDAQVERTRTRPLASGEISVRHALCLLTFLLLTALMIAVFLGQHTVLWAMAALPLVALYPLMKRITHWPQAFLGLTFNWGALLGTVAVRGEVTAEGLWLYAAGFFWTLGYDTIYAHQDKRDDVQAGIKSTALALGTRTKPFVALFYAACLACFIVAGATIQAAPAYFGLIFLAGVHFYLQLQRVELDHPASCLRVFKSNQLTGLLFFLATLCA